jgi:hypothetical protein
MNRIEKLLMSIATKDGDKSVNVLESPIKTNDSKTRNGDSKSKKGN